MLRFKMKETDDFKGLLPFFIENGLEYSEDEEAPEGLVQCWKVVHGDENDEHLTAGLVLSKRAGEYVIDSVGVSKLFRKFKIGKILMDKAIKTVIEKGGKRIYIVAKVPEYFKKFGFVPIKREEAPDFSECFSCEQFGNGCDPQVMRLDLE
mgnify:CR=1 FL=1